MPYGCSRHARKIAETFYIPAFKPVAAISVISGMALGPQSGFMVGSLSAITSNIFFGQGPWTPFQMLVWGLIGAVSGLIFFERRKASRISLVIIGVLSGASFSLIMDIWTALFIDGTFHPARYITLLLTSIPMMVTYAVSNVIFLLVLSAPISRKLERIRTKYGLFRSE